MREREKITEKKLNLISRHISDMHGVVTIHPERRPAICSKGILSNTYWLVSYLTVYRGDKYKFLPLTLQ